MHELNDDIIKYKKGLLSPAEMHALEKKALFDPFLADALEGINDIGEKEFDSDINLLSQKIRPVVKTSFMTPLRVAASLFIVVSIGAVIFFVNRNDEPVQLASTQNKSAEPAKVAADSVAKDVDEKPKDLLTLNQPAEKKSDVSKNKAAKTTKPEASGESESVAAQAEEITELQEKNEEVVADDKVAMKLDLTLDSVKSLAANAPVQAELRKESARDLAPARASSGAAGFASKRSVRKIKGQVLSEEDGTPLPGVNVVVKGTTQGTVSDINGNYSLDVGADSVALVFSFIGFQTADVNAREGSNANVRLKEDLSQLSEVVVTGYSPNKDDATEPVIKMAGPVGGRRAYNRYLESSLRYPQQALENNIKGRVTISFTVGLDGGLDEFTVLKGLGYGCDEEVIRLVKEGPAWTPTTQDRVPVESTVRVRLKFDPTKKR